MVLYLITGFDSKIMSMSCPCVDYTAVFPVGRGGTGGGGGRCAATTVQTIGGPVGMTRQLIRRIHLFPSYRVSWNTACSGR